MKYEETFIMNKKGFTVAEIFIALMIVGALTVILFPVIQSSSPDQNKVMFRKTFNTLSQTVSNLSFDDVNYPESPPLATSDTGQSVPQGFSNQTTYTSGVKFCTLLTDQLNTIGPVNCGPPSEGAGWGSFTTADGAFWRVHEGPATAADYRAQGYSCTPSDADCGKSFPMNYSSHAYQTKIFVDVNGSAKGPNCSADSNAAKFPYGSGGAAISRCSWYNVCDPTQDPPIPKGTQTADIYIIGVRFDGNIRLGSSDDGSDTDKCGSIILAQPTTNTN